MYTFSLLSALILLYTPQYVTEGQRYVSLELRIVNQIHFQICYVVCVCVCVCVCVYMHRGREVDVRCLSLYSSILCFLDSIFQ